MDIFNNRELSILIWSSILLAWGLTKPAIRNSLFGVIKCFFVWRIITVVIFMVSYISLLVYLLYVVGVWDTNQLKSTIIWSVSVALLSLFRIHKTKEDKDFFRNSVKDIFRLTIFLEFIADFFSFNLIFELIFIPLTVFLGGVLAYSQTDNKFESAEKLLNNVFSLLGFFLIAYAGYRISSDISAFTSLNTLSDFYTPPLLSLGFLPFLFIMLIYHNYETAFIRIKHLIKEESLHQYAKIKAGIKFNVNFKLLKRWLNSLVYLQIESKDDIDLSIHELESTLRREKNPQKVPFSQGWCPFKAKSYLEESGLISGDYHSIGENEWHASSPYLEIGEGIIPDKIAYYIYGEITVAKLLKLVLNNNNNNTDEDSLCMFLDIAKLLYKKALDKEMTINIEKAILSGRRKKIRIKGKAVSVKNMHGLKKVSVAMT
jgi:hypothetical protein